MSFDPARLTLRGAVGGEPRTFLLGPGLHRVGSRPGRGMVLAHRGVSKRHALLVVTAEQVTVDDLGSKNGTFVNDHRVESAELALGDRLRFGPLELILEMLPRDALVLDIEPPSSGSAERLSGFETPHHLDQAEPDSESWFGALDAFGTRLATTGGDLALALVSLARTLGADGALVAEARAGDPPAIHAATSVPPADLVAALRSEPGPSSGRAASLALPPTVDAIAGGRARSLGDADARWILALWGGPRRDPGSAVWNLLLTLVDRARGEPRDPPVESRRLALPEDHVRGSSPAMERLYVELAAVAATGLPVLVLGATGVGKEGIARAVHASSPRRSRPFVAINCAAIPDELLEAELFGVGKAVATGVDARPGRFRDADGGTLLLDEIGEMAPALQAKLLRALEQREVTPLGGRPVAIDVRVVAATNARLAEHLDDGSFRRDLYHRLAGCVLRVPSLAERRDDIPSLVEHFLRRAATDSGHAVRGLTRDALAALVDHPWDGNVRQLQHAVCRLAYGTTRGQIIDLERVRRVLDQDDAAGREPLAALPTLDLATLERRAIEQALDRADGHQTRAAAWLGISRTALYRRLIKHGLVDADVDFDPESSADEP